MISPKSLLERARTSADGEAYASLAKGRGFRVAIGAREARDRAPAIFIEVFLDPFPERPQVSAERLADQSDYLARLRARGYEIACDDDGTITCERAVKSDTATDEARTVKRMLEGGRHEPRGRRAPSPRS